MNWEHTCCFMSWAQFNYGIMVARTALKLWRDNFFYSPDKILLTKYTLHLSRISAGKGQSSYAFKSKAFPSEKQLQQMAACFLRRQNLLYYW